MDELNTEACDIEETGGVTEQSEKPQTVCRDCSFSVYEGDTQTGCLLGNIEKLAENGAEIVESYDETGREFNVINDRLCVFWRHPQWEEIPYVKKLGKEVAAQEESSLRFSIMLYLDENSTIQQVSKTVTSIIEQDKPPVGLHFMNKSMIKPSDLVKEGARFTKTINKKFQDQGLSQYAFCAKRYWKVDQIKDPESDIYRCLDLCIQSIKPGLCTHYALFNSGYEIPANFISSINDFVNVEMKRFLVILPESGEDGLVAQTHMHKSIGGNKQKMFTEKMVSVCEDQECSYLVKNLSEIIPQE